ncbi:MAG: hypothetical protein NTY02_01265 [Acidobacteria bacterium]|nr:hypothetical protein [Acidobacteriota bacterium]
MTRTPAHLAIVACCALTLSGCLVLSVQPFSSPDVEFFEPALEGTWINAKEELSWTFARAKAGSTVYSLTDLSEAENAKPSPQAPKAPLVTSSFEARLFRVGDVTFLDLYPDRCEDCRASAIWLSHVPPMHAAWRIAIDKQAIRVTPVDLDHVLELLKSGKLKTPNVVRDSGSDDKLLLLTAPPKDLQSFLRAILADTEAFGDETVLTRK